MSRVNVVNYIIKTCNRLSNKFGEYELTYSRDYFLKNQTCRNPGSWMHIRTSQTPMCTSQSSDAYFPTLQYVLPIFRMRTSHPDYMEVGSKSIQHDNAVKTSKPQKINNFDIFYQKYHIFYQKYQNKFA